VKEGVREFRRKHFCKNTKFSGARRERENSSWMGELGGIGKMGEIGEMGHK
jgi:hypothetical protein